MAEELSEASWTGFVTKLQKDLDASKVKFDLDDSSLVKALRKFGKTDESKLEPRLAALQEVIDQIVKVVPALLKRKKAIGDKPFKEAKDKLYALQELAEALKKEAWAEAAADGEEETPALLTSKMIPLIRELRDGDATMRTLVAIAGKETVVLLSRKEISPTRGKLLKAQMTNPGGLKFIRGECLLEQGALTFVVQAPAAGLAKRLRAALFDQTQLRLKVRVRGEDPGDVDDDGEDEGDALEPADSATASGSIGASLDDASQAVADALKSRFEKRLEALEVLVADALRLQQGEVSKIRAVAAFAREKGEAKSYDTGLKALHMLETLLEAGGIHVPSTGEEARVQMLTAGDPNPVSHALSSQTKPGASPQIGPASTSSETPPTAGELRKRLDSMVPDLKAAIAGPKKAEVQALLQSASDLLKTVQLAPAAKAIGDLETAICDLEALVGKSPRNSAVTPEELVARRILAMQQAEAEVEAGLFNSKAMPVFATIQSIRALSPSLGDSLLKRLDEAKGIQPKDHKAAVAALNALGEYADRITRRLTGVQQAEASDLANAMQAQAAANQQPIPQQPIIPQPLPQQPPQSPTQGLLEGLEKLFAKLKSLAIVGPTLAPLLDVKLTSCLDEADDNRRLQMTQSVFDEVDEISTLARLAAETVSANPDRKKDILSKLGAAATTEARKELTATLSDLIQRGQAAAQAALKALNAETDLTHLTLKRRIELIADLRRGDEASREDRRDAIAMLYTVTELDEKFMKKDDQRREQVHEGLKNSPILNQAWQEWNKPLPKREKLEVRRKAIQEALEIQCAALGINPVPAVEYFSEPTAQVDADHKLSCAGYFQKGKLYINDESASFDDFDDVLDTVIHENTHNYQSTLVEKLEAGEIKEGDDEYEQVLLFQLNAVDGHFEGNNRPTTLLMQRLEKGEIKEGDPEYAAAVAAQKNNLGYMNSPLERQAWLAGGETHKLFLDDAKARGQELLTQMQTTAQRLTALEPAISKYIQILKKTVEDGSTSEIMKQVRTYRASLEDLVRTRQQPEVDMRQKLLEDMRSWLQDNAWAEASDGFQEKFDQLVLDVEALLETPKNRGSMKSLTMRTEVARASFAGLLWTTLNDETEKLCKQPQYGDKYLEKYEALRRKEDFEAATAYYLELVKLGQ